MKRKKEKVLSLVLCIAVVLSSMFAFNFGFSVFADDNTNTGELEVFHLEAYQVQGIRYGLCFHQYQILFLPVRNHLNERSDYYKAGCKANFCW